MREAGVPGDISGGRARVRGGARLKVLVWLLILAAGIYVAVKIVPIYFADYQLQDKMNTEARFATVNRRSDEELREIIFREIQGRDIPARREDIRIEQSTRGVRISVDYTVPVDLKVYQLSLHFSTNADSRAL